MRYELPEIDDSLCTGCEACVEACPPAALTMVDNKAVLGDPEVCDLCGECEAACPLAAIGCPFEIVLDEGEG